MRKHLPPAFGKSLTNFTPVYVTAGVEALIARPCLLADSGLNDAGWGIGVVFQEFERIAGHPGVDEIEATVEIRFVAVPRFFSHVKGGFGKTERSVGTRCHTLNGVQAHLMNLTRLIPQISHFCGCKNIGRILIPVMLQIVWTINAIGQAFINNGLFPAGASHRKFFAFHIIFRDKTPPLSTMCSIGTCREFSSGGHIEQPAQI